MSDFFGKINWVDVFIIIILIRTSYIGFTQGLIYELLTIAGVFGSILLTVHNYEILGEVFHKNVNLPINFSNLLSFLILALGVIFLFRYIRNGLYKFLKFEIFPTLEKYGGIAAGFLRGSLIASTVLVALLLIPNDYISKSIQHRSAMGNAFLRIVPISYNYFIDIMPGYAKTRKNKLVKKLLKLDDEAKSNKAK